ncbi:MAG: MFS transporter [Chloroflexi bacterium]|nr:MFS transporter [Chloroflexota bacterium]MCY4246813.1 MFS transporter [Chloroflexota bacterium]
MMTGRHGDARWLFALACLVFMVGGVSGSAIGVVWIYVQADFNVTLSALGALVTAATLGRLLTSSTSGPLINRFGIAFMMMAGLVIAAGSMLGFALAGSWLAVMLVAFGSGLGAGVMATGLNAFAAVHFSARQMNWLHGSWGIGSTIGPLLITFIVIDLSLDWRWAYVIFTIVRLLLFGLFFLTRQRWRLSEARADDAGAQHASLATTLRLPIIWLMVGAFMLATGVELVAGQFANSFLIEARDIDAKTAGGWVSLYWASLTISRFAAGMIIARIGNARFLRLNGFGMLLGAGLLAANQGALASLLGLALLGFAIAPFAPMLASDTPSRVGRAHVANAIGLQFAGASIGMALLPWLAGALAEAQGLEIIPRFVFVTALATLALHEAISLRERSRRARRA